MNEELKKIRSVYFIGIGGIGMSAIARFFDSIGVRVSGYDKTESVLTKELQRDGIDIHYEENPALIPKDVDLVVYTPAIPDDHAELLYYRQHGFKVVKRSDVLQLITSSSFNICIAGTHGKTTTTTMIAHLLRDSGFGCTAFLGGISVNYGTNFWASQNNVFVIEADEYDRSFLKLNPNAAVVTAMDPDHLDIYGTAEAMEDAFIEFSSRIKDDGLLVSKFGLSRGSELKASTHLTYSLQNESADAFAKNIKMVHGGYEFDLVIRDRSIEGMKLNIGGLHNVENAVAAVTIASSLNIGAEEIKAAMTSFKGVKRRFEYIVKNDRIVFIDDYAHHPEELRALINGAKSLFRQRKCTMIFQPHLYTRTRDLANGFAAVLDMADEIILLPVYPAREEPIPGVSSGMILDKMKNARKGLMQKDELLRWMRERYAVNVNTEFGEVLITAGAGDIDLLVGPIKEILEKI